MTTHAGTAAPAFRTAIVDAARELWPIEGTVQVADGHPGVTQLDDLISILGVEAEQEPGPISNRRIRDEKLTLDFVAWCYRAGGPEQEPIARAAAYALVMELAEYVRVTDTTLGGAVKWCFLSSHREEGTLDDDVIAEGRLVTIYAQLTAEARVQI